MSLNHQKLFRIAAIVNVTAGLPLLLLPSYTMGLLGVPLGAGGILMTQISGLAIAAFGLLYWAVAANPGQLRPIVPAGIIVKMGVVVLVTGHFLSGSLDIIVPALISADLVFSLLFYQFLRETRDT